MSSIYLSNRFFLALGMLAGMFALSFSMTFLYPVAIGLSTLLLGITIAEIYFVFRQKKPLDGKRVVPNILSLSDSNTVTLTIHNNTNQSFRLQVIDELPPELEVRKFNFDTAIHGLENIQHQYHVKPFSRGKYHFGYLNCFLSTLLHFVQRRVQVAKPQMVPVYPSIIQMKELELKTLASIAIAPGIKKLRRIGHSYEFEQIKVYQRGDDIRSINWKASSKRNELMINQYEDERSQQIYCIIDKSRVMRMPFNGLTLMDYAINTSLALSNIILKKHDKPGLITFSDKLGSLIPAAQHNRQLQKILNALYGEKDRQVEANYDLLHYATRKLINGRSMLLLFTNFESNFALERVLPTLRKVNKNHLLVVILFINTEIEDFAKQTPKTTEDLYRQTTAEKFLYEKKQMTHRLRQYGIQTIITRPEDLSINSINKYLELKSKGMI